MTSRQPRGLRRATLLLAGAAAGTLLFSGCGAGQIAETAAKESSISGINAETPDGSFKIRNVAVEYLDTQGYLAGAAALIEAVVYNDTGQAVTLQVSTTSARTVELVVGPAPAATAGATIGAPAPSTPTTSSEATATSAPGESAHAVEPVPTAAPVQPSAGAPARIDIPAGGFVVLNKTAGRYLQLVGLHAALPPGQSIDLVFDFGNQRIATPVPVQVPLSPAPLGSAANQDTSSEHG